MYPSVPTRHAALAQSLRQGLTYSAGFHLTLAVLLFGGLRSFSIAPPVVDVPVDPWVEHRIIDVGEYGGPPPPAPAPAPTGPAVVIPVDDGDPVRDVPIVEPSQVPPSAFDGDVLDGRTGPGSGTTEGITEEIDPGPNDIVVHDIEPEVIRRVIPVYPEMARQAGMEGRVWVRVLIGKAGEVRRVEIERSAPLFDEAALDAVKRWTFRPAVASGNPVAVWVRIPIVFRMN